MRILFLTQWFAPEPAFKGLPFAKELVRRGHRVEVLTGFPNYPGGRLYPGYRIRWRQREVMDGIPVTRVPLYPSHDQSAVGRVANYVSFAVAAASIGLCSVEQADVAYVYQPPATVMLPAIVLRALRRVPYVLDIQDLWPDTLKTTGMVKSEVVLRAVGAWCQLGYLSAARIAVLSPGFKKALMERGVSPAKIDVVYNWCDEKALTRTEPEAAAGEEPPLAGRFKVLFAGTMGRAQALWSVLEGARLVAVKCPDVQFVFVGGGIEANALRAKADEKGLGNVTFLPARPSSAMGPLLRAADLLLVHLREDPLFTITIPSKTQAYLAAGRPILMAVSGDAASLVENAGAGVCIKGDDPDALARAVCDLACWPPEKLSEMGERGRAYYDRALSIDAGVTRFEELFREASIGAWPS